MENFEDMLQKGFYDENSRKEAHDFAKNNQSLDPNAAELLKMFPASGLDNPVIMPNPHKDIPEYKQEKFSDQGEGQDNGEAKSKKLTQNQRLKKQLEEKEKENATLKKANDEYILALAAQKQKDLNASMLILEKDKKEFAKLAADEAYREEYYRANEQYNEAHQAKIRAMRAIAEEAKREEDIRILKRDYEQTNQIINQAYQEYQQKDYSYKPQYEYETDDNKNDAQERFLRAHPFLDMRGNNPNFSKNLKDEADKLANTLADKYKIEGRGKEVYTDSFYEDLSRTLKDNLRNTFSSVLPNQTNNQQSYNPYGDGMNMNKFSSDFSAPVTPTSTSRIRYSAPMNEGDKQTRANFIQAAKSLGLSDENLAESYDNIYNTYKKSY